MQARPRVHRDRARAERGVRRGRQSSGGPRPGGNAGQDTDVDGDRTGHRAAAGKEGDVTIAELFQRPCTADRPFEDERVPGDVNPGILRERGRPRENVPVIDGEHRRVRRTALAGGKGQGTEAGPEIPAVRGHRRVIQDRDVVEEVHVPLQVNGIRRTAGCRITRIQTHG